MTNEELNTALYEKMFAEQQRYREWLLSQPPDEILNHCYEFTVREDIVLALEYHDLSDKQCKALLQSRSPLADVFKDFEKRETDHMDNIRDTIGFEGVTALDTVRRSGGRAVAIPDDKILDAMRACAKMEAVIPEPASAATIAAAVKLHEDGVIGDDDRVVCVLTGSGLRDLKLFNNENADIPSVKPGDMDSLKQAVEHYQK